MYNSILHFNEFGIAKIGKVIKEFMEDKDRNLGDLVMELEKPMQELQREIIKETIEAVDELAIPKIILEVKEKRKKKVLYINADEDHVSLQFRHKKGDLTENEK